MIPVVLIPAFQDNYIFLIAAQKSALVVDPGRAKEVLAYLEQQQLKLEKILVTHHHHDHVGGVEELKRRTGAQVYAPKHVRDQGLPVDQVCTDGSSLRFHETQFEVMATPGHTLDHIAYFSSQEDILFCGDTLFSLGCGRLFEGSFETMFATLGKFKMLPTSTRVFCAHEYTLKNLEFSLHMLNLRQDVIRLKEYTTLAAQLRNLRAAGDFTIPSTLDFEWKYNLFLNAPSVEKFQILRNARDQF